MLVEGGVGVWFIFEVIGGCILVGLVDIFKVYWDEEWIIGGLYKREKVNIRLFWVLFNLFFWKRGRILVVRIWGESWILGVEERF